MLLKNNIDCNFGLTDIERASPITIGEKHDTLTHSHCSQGNRGLALALVLAGGAKVAADSSTLYQGTATPRCTTTARLRHSNYRIQASGRLHDHA